MIALSVQGPNIHAHNRHSSFRLFTLAALLIIPLLSAAQFSRLEDIYNRVSDIWGKNGKAYEYYLNEMLRTKSIDMQTLRGYSSGVYQGMNEQLSDLQGIKAEGKNLEFRDAIIAYCKAANGYMDNADKMFERLQLKGVFDKEVYQDLVSTLNNASGKMVRLYGEAKAAESKPASPPQQAAQPVSVPAGPAALIRFTAPGTSGTAAKYGLRETGGKIILPAEYDLISTGLDYPESERDKNNAAGYFLRKGMKYGFANTAGKVIIPPVYDLIGHLREGLFFVGQKGKYGYADENGKLVIPLKFNYDMTAGQEEGSSLFSEIRYFRNGFAPFSVAGKWGLINKAGVPVVPAKYDEVSDINNGYAMVKSSAGTGFVNAKGVLVLKPAVREVMGQVYNGAVIVKQDNKYFILDILKGTQSRVPYTEMITGFNEWGLAMVEAHDHYGYINAKGQTVFEAKYDFPKNDFDHGLIALSTGMSGRYALYDTNGKYLTSDRYDFVGRFRNGLAPVNVGRQYGMINLKGDEVVSPVYDYMGEFSNGRACVGSRKYGSGVYGFIDEQGKLVIPMIYDEPGNFICGQASVRRNGRRYEIDTQGQEIKQ